MNERCLLVEDERVNFRPGRQETALLPDPHICIKMVWVLHVIVGRFISSLQCQLSLLGIQHMHVLLNLNSLLIIQMKLILHCKVHHWTLLKTEVIELLAENLIVQGGSSVIRR